MCTLQYTDTTVLRVYPTVRVSNGCLEDWEHSCLFLGLDTGAFLAEVDPDP